MVSEPSAILRTSVWIARPGKAADLSTEEKRKQSVAAVWAGFYSRWEGPAAETIQRWWRGHAARRFVSALHHGRLLKIGTRERVEESAAVVIQRFWRGWLGRREAAERRKAAVDIQRWWKGYRARKEWPRLRLRWRARNYYATDIQKWVRGHLVRLRVRRMREQQQQGQQGQGRHGSSSAASGDAADPRREAAATLIQAHWRGHQARKRRAWLQREAAKRKRYEQRLAATKVIQSYYRGWYVRRAVALLRAKEGGTLRPGSLAGGAVAAPGIAGDVRSAVLLPYGEYDDNGEQQDERPVPHGHPRPPPLPRAVAPPALRGRIGGGGGGGGGVRGMVRRAPPYTAAPAGGPARAAPTGPVKAPGGRGSAVNLRQAQQLRASPALPSPPPSLPSKPPPTPPSASTTSQPSSTSRRSVVQTAAGSGLSSIRAVRAAAASTTLGAAAAVGLGVAERKKQPPPSPLLGPQQQQRNAVHQLGEVRHRQEALSSPVGVKPPSPSSPPGPLRSPPAHGGGASVRTTGAASAASQPPPSPVTPPQRSLAAASAGRGGLAPGPGTAAGGASGPKPSTASAPLGRALSSNAAGGGGGGAGRNLGGSSLRVRQPSMEDGDGVGGDYNLRSPRPLRSVGGSGGAAPGAATSPSRPRVGAPAPLAMPRTPSMPVPTANRHDPLRASAPEPLRTSASVGGGGGGGGGGGREPSATASAAASQRRRAWESEGSISASAPAAVPNTSHLRASGTATVTASTPPLTPPTVAAADAAGNPFHDQVMRANRGGRVVNGVAPGAAASPAAAAQRRRAEPGR